MSDNHIFQEGGRKGGEGKMEGGERGSGRREGGEREERGRKQRATIVAFS